MSGWIMDEVYLYKTREQEDDRQGIQVPLQSCGPSNRIPSHPLSLPTTSAVEWCGNVSTKEWRKEFGNWFSLIHLCGWWFLLSNRHILNLGLRLSWKKARTCGISHHAPEYLSYRPFCNIPLCSIWVGETVFCSWWKIVCQKCKKWMNVPHWINENAPQWMNECTA